MLFEEFKRCKAFKLVSRNSRGIREESKIKESNIELESDDDNDYNGGSTTVKNNLKCNSCHFVRKTHVFEIIFDFFAAYSQTFVFRF